MLDRAVCVSLQDSIDIREWLSLDDVRRPACILRVQRDCSHCHVSLSVQMIDIIDDTQRKKYTKFLKREIAGLIHGLKCLLRMMSDSHSYMLLLHSGIEKMEKENPGITEVTPQTLQLLKDMRASLKKMSKSDGYGAQVSVGLVISLRFCACPSSLILCPSHQFGHKAAMTSLVINFLLHGPHDLKCTCYALMVKVGMICRVRPTLCRHTSKPL